MSGWQKEERNLLNYSEQWKLLLHPLRSTFKTLPPSKNELQHVRMLSEASHDQVSTRSIDTDAGKHRGEHRSLSRDLGNWQAGLYFSECASTSSSQCLSAQQIDGHLNPWESKASTDEKEKLIFYCEQLCPAPLAMLPTNPPHKNMKDCNHDKKNKSIFPQLSPRCIHTIPF